MNKDYAYCNTSSCIHRRGCKRWIGNYEGVFEPLEWINHKECEPDYKDVNCDNDFQFLDRFRLSDGSAMK